MYKWQTSSQMLNPSICSPFCTRICNLYLKVLGTWQVDSNYQAFILAQTVTRRGKAISIEESAATPHAKQTTQSTQITQKVYRQIYTNIT